MEVRNGGGEVQRSWKNFKTMASVFGMLDSIFHGIAKPKAGTVATGFLKAANYVGAGFMTCLSEEWFLGLGSCLACFYCQFHFAKSDTEAGQ